MSTVEKSSEGKLDQFEERRRVVNVCRSASNVLIGVLIVLRTHAHRCTSDRRIALCFQRNPLVLDCGMYLRNRGSRVRIPPAALCRADGHRELLVTVLCVVSVGRPKRPGTRSQAPPRSVVSLPGDSPLHSISYQPLLDSPSGHTSPLDSTEFAPFSWIQRMRLGVHVPLG
jgi:hypothetical protein